MDVCEWILVVCYQSFQSESISLNNAFAIGRHWQWGINRVMISDFSHDVM